MHATVHGIELVEPHGGKEARAHAVTPLFADSRVHFPHVNEAPWVEVYTKSLVDFPKAMNDDDVDATTQALLFLRDNGDFAAAMDRVAGA